MITNEETPAPTKIHSCLFVSIRGWKIAGRLHGAGDALAGGMRIISIIVVLAIVYLVYGRSGEKQSPQTRIAEAQREAAAVQPTAPQTASVQTSGSLRGPIDHTRQVLGLVKQRNGE